MGIQVIYLDETHGAAPKRGCLHMRKHETSNSSDLPFRRKLLAVFGSWLAVVPFGLWGRVATSKVETATENDSLIVGEVVLELPPGYSRTSFEADMADWANNSELNKLIESFKAAGSLSDFNRIYRDNSVEYKFHFNGQQSLESFVATVRQRKLVDFRARAQKGIVVRMKINGREIVA